MTHRLYYDDAYARHFSGTVIDTTPVGGAPAALLDRSLFYPTSGGQPHDTGRLGSAAVIDVQVRESDQAVLHLLDVPLPPGPVEGVIDWVRRFDHMQQHSGQHVLSQAFLRTAEAPTVGFHLGTDLVSIDLAVPSLADSAIAEAESLANQVVTADLPVRAWFPDPAELQDLALRKHPDVAGPIRVVAIGEFDRSACGGTHVASTGVIGLVAVQRAERLKGGLRVEFLCGGRARADYALKQSIVRGVSAALTCSAAELVDSVTRLQESLRVARRELSAYRERELDQEAERLLTQATRGGGPALLVVRAAWPERPADELKALALRLTARPGVAVLLGSAGSRTHLVFGRSLDLALDLEPPFRRALDLLGGGRGGGTRLLQGGAGSADLERLQSTLAQVEAGLAGALG